MNPQTNNRFDSQYGPKGVKQMRDWSIMHRKLGKKSQVDHLDLMWMTRERDKAFSEYMIERFLIGYLALFRGKIEFNLSIKSPQQKKRDEGSVTITIQDLRKAGILRPDGAFENIDEDMRDALFPQAVAEFAFYSYAVSQEPVIGGALPKLIKPMHDFIKNEQYVPLRPAVLKLFEQLNRKAVHPYLTNVVRKYVKNTASSPIIHSTKPWILDGTMDDIQLRYESGYRSIIKSPNDIIGLEQNVIIRLPNGQRVLVTDHHNNAYTFWWLMKQEGILPETIDLLHIDQHIDSFIPEQFSIDKEPFNNPAAEFSDINQYSIDVLDIAGFIAPLAEIKKINNWYWMFWMSKEKRHVVLKVARKQKILRDGRKEVQYLHEEFKETEWKEYDLENINFNVLDIDIDVLDVASDSEVEEALNLYTELAQKVDLITIATSPGDFRQDAFIDQSKSFDAAKRLVAKLQVMASSPINGENGKVHLSTLLNKIKWERHSCQ